MKSPYINVSEFVCGSEWMKVCVCKCKTSNGFEIREIGNFGVDAQWFRRTNESCFVMIHPKTIFGNKIWVFWINFKTFNKLLIKGVLQILKRASYMGKNCRITIIKKQYVSVAPEWNDLASNQEVCWKIYLFQFSFFLIHDFFISKSCYCVQSLPFSRRLLSCKPKIRRF